MSPHLRRSLQALRRCKGGMTGDRRSTGAGEDGTMLIDQTEAQDEDAAMTTNDAAETPAQIAAESDPRYDHSGKWPIDEDGWQITEGGSTLFPGGPYAYKVITPSIIFL
jgi:hypothetical protein